MSDINKIYVKVTDKRALFTQCHLFVWTHTEKKNAREKS